MSRIATLFLFVLILTTTAAFRANATAPEKIHTWEDLNNIRNDLAGNYVLMNDLGPEDEGYNDYASKEANNHNGWTPIGTTINHFTGSLDGNGYSINGLNVNQTVNSSGSVGLFGYIKNGAISDLGVTGEVFADIHEGLVFVGLLAGTAENSTIKNTFARGSVDLNSHPRRKAADKGQESDEIVFWTGGLVGHNLSGNIESSFADVEVSGNGIGHLGGLTGMNSGRVTNSYATGRISGNTKGASTAGGLSAVNLDGGTVKESYSVTMLDLEGNGVFGGLIGYNVNNEESVSNSFWNVETSGLGEDGQTSGSMGGLGLSTTRMKNKITYTEQTDPGWNFTSTWAIYEEDSGYKSYPFLQAITYDDPQADDPGNPIPGLDPSGHEPTPVPVANISLYVSFLLMMVLLLIKGLAVMPKVR